MTLSWVANTLFDTPTEKPVVFHNLQQGLHLLNIVGHGGLPVDMHGSHPGDNARMQDDSRQEWWAGHLKAAVWVKACLQQEWESTLQLMR